MKDVFIKKELGELDKLEKNLNYTERRMIDLVHQTLNQNSNNIQDYQNVVDLFKVYNKALASKTNDDFKKSMQNSGLSYQNDKVLEKNVLDLNPNNPNSFIILPIASTTHQFAAVIRREDDHFSATVINKGERPRANTFSRDEVKPDGTQMYSTKIKSPVFMRYDIKPHVMPKLLKNLRDSIGNESTHQVYHTLKNNASKVSALNIEAKNQKVGNCFIKEPENAIKFAFATKDFTKEDFKKIEPNFIKFSSKWDSLTDQMHRNFISVIRNEFPKISKILNIRYENYSMNKRFRELMEKDPNKDCEKALIKAFDSEGRYRGIEPKTRMKKMMANVNIDTMEEYGCKLIDLAKSLDDKKFFKGVESASYMTNGLAFPGLSKRLGPKQTIITLDSIKENFPFLAGQLKYEYAASLFWDGVTLGETFHRPKNIELDLAKELYPYNYHNHCYSGALKLETGQAEDIPKAVKDLDTAISLKPNYASAIFIRGLALEELGQKSHANKDFETVKKIAPQKYEQWKNTKPREIFFSYFQGLPFEKKKEANKQINISKKVSKSKGLEL